MNKEQLNSAIDKLSPSVEQKEKMLSEIMRAKKLVPVVHSVPFKKYITAAVTVLIVGACVALTVDMLKDDIDSRMELADSVFKTKTDENAADRLALTGKETESITMPSVSREENNESYADDNETIAESLKDGPDAESKADGDKTMALTESNKKDIKSDGNETNRSEAGSVSGVSGANQDNSVSQKNKASRDPERQDDAGKNKGIEENGSSPETGMQMSKDALTNKNSADSSPQQDNKNESNEVNMIPKPQKPANKPDEKKEIPTIAPDAENSKNEKNDVLAVAPKPLPKEENINPNEESVHEFDDVDKVVPSDGKPVGIGSSGGGSGSSAGSSATSRPGSGADSTLGITSNNGNSSGGGSSGGGGGGSSASSKREMSYNDIRNHDAYSSVFPTYSANGFEFSGAVQKSGKLVASYQNSSGESIVVTVAPYATEKVISPNEITAQSGVGVRFSLNCDEYYVSYSSDSQNADELYKMATSSPYYK